MKILRFVFFAALAALSTRGFAAENRYEVFGQALTPFVAVFAEKNASGAHAFQLTARLEALTDLPPALLGSRIELAVEAPDRLRLHAPFLGENVTLCRDGQRVWASPGSKISALLDAATAHKKLPAPDPKFRLAPFRLPIPAKQLVFLPALFQVKDIGTEPLDGEPCRVLDVFLMPELAKALKVPGWAARVWVRDDGKPARLSIAKSDWQIALRIEHLEFSRSLPEAVWKPTPEEAADAVELNPAQYQQLLGAFGK